MSPPHAAFGFGRAAPLVVAVALALGGCSQGMSKSDDTVIQSSELTTEFTNRHEGPDWLLARAQQLKLTPDEVTALTALQARQVADRHDKVAAIEAAYRRFKADSATRDPSISALTADLRELSDAQLALTTAVIDGNLQGYALLTPPQKKQSDDLIACCTPA